MTARHKSTYESLIVITSLIAMACKLIRRFCSDCLVYTALHGVWCSIAVIFSFGLAVFCYVASSEPYITNKDSGGATADVTK